MKKKIIYLFLILFFLNTKISPNIMHDASAEGNIKALKLLSQNEINQFKDELNSNGDMPIHCAARNSHVSVINYLINNGISINCTNLAGETILHILAKDWQKDNSQAIYFLLKRGAYINAQDNVDSSTPLHRAVFYNNCANVLTLLKFKSTDPQNQLNLNLQNSFNQTPFQLAQILHLSGFDRSQILNTILSISYNLQPMFVPIENPQAYCPECFDTLQTIIDPNSQIEICQKKDPEELLPNAFFNAQIEAEFPTLLDKDHSPETLNTIEKNLSDTSDDINETESETEFEVNQEPLKKNNNISKHQLQKQKKLANKAKKLLAKHHKKNLSRVLKVSTLNIFQENVYQESIKQDSGSQEYAIDNLNQLDKKRFNLYDAISKNKTLQEIEPILTLENIIEKNKDGNSPLHFTVMFKNVPVCKRIIEILEDRVDDLEFQNQINCINIFGYTPLHYAILKDFHLADYLLSKGADDKLLPEKTKDKLFAFKNPKTKEHVVVSSIDPVYDNLSDDQIQLLKENVQTSRNLEDTKSKYLNLDKNKLISLLHVSIEHYVRSKDPILRKKIKEIIEAGADVNIPMLDCLTCLHLFSGLNDVDMISHLLSHGADVSAKDILGNTPLHVALYRRKSEAIARLCYKGDHLTIKNNDLLTPFILSMLTNCYNLFKEHVEFQVNNKQLLIDINDIRKQDKNNKYSKLDNLKQLIINSLAEIEGIKIPNNAFLDIDFSGVEPQFILRKIAI